MLTSRSLYLMMPMEDGFLAVVNPALQTASVCGQRVLPFGSIASVTVFLRVSLALWAVDNRLLKLTWPAYFDSFSVSEATSAKRADLCITSLFCFLGWKLSESKLVPFLSVCKVLGVQLDLRDAKLGAAQVSDAPERVEELTRRDSEGPERR